MSVPAAMTDATTGVPANLLSILINTKDKGVILPFSSLSVELN